MKGRLLGIVGDSLISFWDTIDRIPEEPDLDTVILPIGSVEQHSHHLPVGMDLIAPHCAEILEGDPKNDIHAGEKGRLLFQQIVEDYVAAIEDAFRYGEGGAW